MKAIIIEEFTYKLSPSNFEIIEGYLNEVEKRSHPAYKNHKSVILKCLNWVKKPLETITMLEVKEYFEKEMDLVASTKLSSKEAYRSYLNSFFDYVVSYMLSEKKLYNNPVPNKRVFKFSKKSNDIKKVSEEVTEVYTVNELQILLDNAKLNRFRDFIVYGILISTGMRISECLSIKIQNINLKQRYIETGFVKNARKSDKGLLFFIPEGFIPYLENYLLYLGKTAGWLFPSSKGKHLTVDGMRGRANRYFGYEYSLFHQFRRTKITKQMKMGCNPLISEVLMNHAPSSVEGQSYVKLSIDEKRDYFDQFFPFKQISYF